MTNTKTKKQIIIREAAARLFREKGYPATSVRDLAQAVELKPSSLYNHIASKEEILQEICFETAERFRDGIEEIKRQKITVKEKVEQLIQLHIRMALEDVTSVTSFNDEWRHLSEPHLTEFKQMRKDYEYDFKQIIKEGIQEGVFMDVDANVALYTVLSSIRWLYDWRASDKKLKAADLEDQVTKIVMQGLCERV